MHSCTWLVAFVPEILAIKSTFVQVISKLHTDRELLCLKFCKPCTSIFSSLEVAAFNGHSEMLKYPE